MSSVNKVILIGNVVKDPQTIQIGESLEVAKFTIALNEYKRSNDGEKIKVTIYVDCEAIGGRIVDIIKEYVHKGTKLYVEGSLRQDTWIDPDTGKQVSKYKIKVKDLTLLSNKKKEEAGESQSVEDSINQDNLTSADEENDLPF